MFQCGKDLHLAQHVFQRLFLHALVLVHVLHGEHPSAVLFLHYAYLEHRAVTMVTEDKEFRILYTSLGIKMDHTRRTHTRWRQIYNKYQKRVLWIRDLGTDRCRPKM